MKRIFGNGSYANVTATLALVIALGGTSYAAISSRRTASPRATVKDRSLLKKDFRPGQLPRPAEEQSQRQRARRDRRAPPAARRRRRRIDDQCVNRAEGVDALSGGLRRPGSSRA